LLAYHHFATKAVTTESAKKERKVFLWLLQQHKITDSLREVLW
jgi:hypothetical protein